MDAWAEKAAKDFTPMSKEFFCLLTKGHPLEENMKKNPAIEVFFVEDEMGLDELPVSENQTLIDLCFFPTNKKRECFARLSKLDVPLMSDLSTNWGERLHREFSSLKVSTNLSFYSPKNTCEFYAQTREMSGLFRRFLENIEIKGVEVKNSGIGFRYPRTVSMIINEAYFLLEEGGADREDIDRAMVYGVNYPLGPFQWAEKIGLKRILSLLDELYDVTRDPRYRASTLLRLEAD